MPVAIVINEDWEVASCLLWAAHFARAANEPLHVLVLVEKGGQAKVVELTRADASVARSPVSQAVLDFVAREDAFVLESADNGEEDDSAATGPVEVRITELMGGDPTSVVQDQIKNRTTSHLILPRHATERGLDAETPWERDLIEIAPCRTIQLRPQARTDGSIGSVLVPLDGTPPSHIALQLAVRLAEPGGATVTALYIQPDIDENAAAVGQRIIEQTVLRAVGSLEGITTKVVVRSSIKKALTDQVGDDHELLLMGVNLRGSPRRFMRSSISESLMARHDGPAVAVVRPALPITNRVTRTVSRFLRARIPQLDRDQRVSLVERIQGSSQWDVDFVALICLSTLIASLGLVQNSPAVVIGAMLVAPLMTPLVGAGLSLVQGNRILIRRAADAVFRGFVLALLIAMVIGWMMPRLEETHEMTARGSPNVLDFVVALVSGIAAAYALGRPNLLSALPGVAIAAALVPPAATVGLALSLGNLSLASGAALLFVTNIVAIILGTALALWAVGIRATHEHGITESWVFRLISALVVLAVALAVYELVPRHAIPESLAESVEQRLESVPQTLLVDVARHPSGTFTLAIESSRPLEGTLIDELGGLVRTSVGRDVEVRIETRLVVISK